MVHSWYKSTLFVVLAWMTGRGDGQDVRRGRCERDLGLPIVIVGCISMAVVAMASCNAKVGVKYIVNEVNKDRLITLANGSNLVIYLLLGS